MYIFLLLAFPVIWAFASKMIWNKTITWLEMFANIAFVSVVVFLMYVAGSYSQTSDTEIWNGAVTGKKQETTSCSHSYACCSIDSEGNNDCSTCYYHSHDYNWVVSSAVGDFYINRVDSQGAVEPKRWSSVKIGDAVSDDHTFTNYIRAVPDSLFHNSNVLVEQFRKHLPKYPEVYDYYKLNHVINVGVKITNLREWNDDLASILRELGPAKQANVILILTNITDKNYATAIEQYWLGGKKNDIVIVISTDGTNILWNKVISWTDQQIFKVTLRDDIDSIKVLNRKLIIDAIDRNTKKYFIRKSMADFEYLKDEIDPPIWVVVFGFIVGILGSIGMSWAAHKRDFFDQNFRRRY